MMADPQLNIFYKAPGVVVPTPSMVEMAAATNKIFDWAGVKVVRTSPTTAVKFGSHVSLIEAKSMLFIAEQAPSIPVPRIHAYFTYGPFGRDIDDFGSDYDNYIVMDFVEGDTAEKAWESLSQNQKMSIANQLSTHITTLRSISPCTKSFIGSVDCGPICDLILENYSLKGPFDTEQDFNDALITAYLEVRPLPNMRQYLENLLAQHQHQIVFTHGDLRPANIIIKGGELSGIVDWQMSGWYPEYWEFSKALYVWRWGNDWGSYLLDALQPYYYQHLVHSLFTEMLW